MKREKLMISMLLVVIIIIAAFNIIASLVMNVNDKRREIGILRAMGATRKNIQITFMLEGFLIGIIGSSLGLLLGLAICYAQKTFGFFKLPADVYFVSQMPILVYVSDIIIIMVVTNLLCVLATIIPAFSAARMNPVDSIRYE
jgi:lipoprotein-releasing system permease protein